MSSGGRYNKRKSGEKITLTVEDGVGDETARVDGQIGPIDVDLGQWFAITVLKVRGTDGLALELIRI